MRSFLVLAFATGLALAQDQASAGQLPTCAQTCISGNNATYGGCSSIDVKCICNQAQYIADLSCCVFKACDAAGQKAALTFAQELCAGAPLPSSASCAATTTGPSSSSTASAGLMTSPMNGTRTSPITGTAKGINAAVSTAIGSNSTTTSGGSTATIASASSTAGSTSGVGERLRAGAVKVAAVLGLVALL